jgi:cyclic pyranopterin phosphate synthase
MEPQDDEMSADEVVRFLAVCEEFGVEEAKFTGGEPMLRDDLEEIIDRTPDSIETSLTTNGTFLPGRAEALKEIGLSRVNVSQDALDPEAFREVTKASAYDDVIEGVLAAVDAGLNPVKLNMVVFEHTAGYVPEMVDHVAENDGLQLQLIEYMPELAGRPDWAVDIERVHGWLEEQADRVERREMHGRRRYFVSGEDGGEGMVEVVDPVGNPDFCANCERVRVTHQGFLKGCLNRNDDLKPMGAMSKPEIREALHETVAERVPYYGEYMLRDDDGGWKVNEKYLDTPLASD